MGDSPSPPPAPAPIIQEAPTPPNYAAANAEAVRSDAKWLGYRRSVDQAAKLGKAIDVTDPETGALQHFDFTGYGDQELAEQQTELNNATAETNAAKMLEIQQKYGGLFNAEQIKRIKESDPTGYQLRLDLAQGVADDLAAGYTLTPDQQREVEQSARGAQAARGNILGNSAALAETAFKGEAGIKMRQQRLGNASAYVLGTPLSAQYQNINAAQAGAAPYMPTQFQGGLQLNPNAAAQGASFALGKYGTEQSGYNAGLSYNANIYSTQMAGYNASLNAPNPWMSGLGMAVGAGSTLGAAAI